MTDAEIIKVLENEIVCVKRQDGPMCPRFVGMTCRACDLITDTSEVLEAFQGAINAIKERMAETARQDEEDARLEALRESRLLDEKEKTPEGRWKI